MKVVGGVAISFSGKCSSCFVGIFFCRKHFISLIIFFCVDFIDSNGISCCNYWWRAWSALHEYMVGVREWTGKMCCRWLLLVELEGSDCAGVVLLLAMSCSVVVRFETRSSCQKTRKTTTAQYYHWRSRGGGWNLLLRAWCWSGRRWRAVSLLWSQELRCSGGRHDH